MGLFILPRTNAAAHRHPQRTCLAALALACLLTANAGTLAGCASSHPITKSGEQCASCHSDGRAAVEGTGSASATETGLTFAVESGAGEVYLCTAAVAEDGTVIPSRDRTLSADELGAVTVSRPGLYARDFGLWEAWQREDCSINWRFWVSGEIIIIFVIARE